MAAAGLWTTATELTRFVVTIQNALRGRVVFTVDEQDKARAAVKGQLGR